VESGTDLAMLQKRLGHQQLSTTLRYYAQTAEMCSK
jgi:site-specific recombinase XerD